MVRGDVIADVGSDHAYLPIWLYLNKKIKKAYALDISENCVNRIRANIKRYKISEDIIVPVLSDGLNGLKDLSDLSDVTDIAIAGMGGMNIAEIIHSPVSGVNYILQPNRKAEFLRDFLHENKFDIIQEIAVESKNRFYTVINARLYT